MLAVLNIPEGDSVAPSKTRKPPQKAPYRLAPRDSGKEAYSLAAVLPPRCRNYVYDAQGRQIPGNRVEAALFAATGAVTAIRLGHRVPLVSIDWAGDSCVPNTSQVTCLLDREYMVIFRSPAGLAWSQDLDNCHSCIAQARALWCEGSKKRSNAWSAVLTVASFLLHDQRLTWPELCHVLMDRKYVSVWRDYVTRRQLFLKIVRRRRQEKRTAAMCDKMA